MLIGSVEATVALVFAIVVLGPIVAERLRIPGIVGLIAGGMLFGPFVLDWLEPDGLVNELGSIGILFLMFLAGLSFDIRSFQRNRSTSVIYGLLGFIIPFSLTVAVLTQSDDIEILGTLLIGAMWASNTLVAYPEVQSAGLQSTRSVGAAVSAGVVADLLSLTVMAFVTSTAVIEIDPPDIPILGELSERLVTEDIRPTTSDPALPLWLGLTLLIVVCLWVLPRVADWFFVRVGRNRSQRVVFMLALMGVGSTVALLGGMEGLIGAFLAGLGLNRLVPARGLLMERLDFVGTTLFVPVFLISIGLQIDPAVLVDPSTIGLGVLFTAFVIVGKSLAAVITGRVKRLSRDEVGLMSSLSFGQAASTLAIAEVGSGLGMFDQDVVNAAVMAIVITAFITSYATRFFASRVPAPDSERPPIGQTILFDTRSNGSDPRILMSFAGAIANADGGVVVPYAVADQSGGSARARSDVDAATATAAALGLDADGVVRVDDSFIDTSVNLVAELDASMILLNWAGPRLSADYLFGNDVDGVGVADPVPTIAAHLTQRWERVVIRLDDQKWAWQRDDAELVAEVGRRVRISTDVPALVFCDDAALAEHLRLGDDDDGLTVVTDPDELEVAGASISATDLVIVPAFLTPELASWRDHRLVGRLRHANLVVVAGPHRLSIGSRAARTGVTAPITRPN